DEILRDRDPLIVVEIQVPDDELVRRVAARRICSSCGRTAPVPAEGEAAATACPACGGPLVTRSDDTEPVVRERLKEYQRDTQPIVAYYGSRPTFRAIDGAQRPDRVYEDIVAAVDAARGVSTEAATPPRSQA